MPGNDEFLEQLKEAFRVEAEELLQRMGEGLHALQSAAVEEHPRLIEALYREVHTLKGAARAVNAGAVEAVCQSLENVFSGWKRSREAAQLSGPMAEALGRAFQVLQQLLHSEAPSQIPLSDLFGQLEELGSQPAAVSPPAQAAPTGQPGKGEPQPAAKQQPLALPESVRVRASQVEELIYQVEQLLPLQQLTRRLLGNLQKALSELGSREALDEAFGAALRQGQEQAALLRVQLRAVSKELADSAARMLMLPASTLLEPLPFMVNDLARSFAKEVRLELGGAELSLDRRILEDLREILIHLLRNAVDHGIELPEERKRLGKDPRGLVSVRFHRLSFDEFELKVRDDGRGVDLGQLKENALRSGAASPASLEKMSAQQAAELMFLSGISTKSAVTEVSGRGLGMAIIRDKVNRLGGRIALELAPGAGTTFRLILPAARSSFRGLLVKAGAKPFVVPMLYLRRALRPGQGQLRLLEGRRVLVFDEALLPVVGLAELLEGRSSVPAAAQPTMLVVSVGGTRVALEVDGIGQEEELLARPLGFPLLRVAYIEAACVVGSGQLVPILDVPDIVGAVSRGGYGRGEEAQAGSEGQGAERPRRKLLVVDDSITSRMLLQSVLESGGYTVTTAVDGAQAWGKLQNEPFDAVVSDIEMPRMNGFDLTARIRGDQRLASLPVVLVTALVSAADRERGLQVGASAYIVKSGFNETGLIEALERLL